MSNTARRVDSIELFWQEWHEARKASTVSVREIAKLVHSNRTSISDLGVPGKSKVWPGKEDIAKLCAAIQLSEADQLAWTRRYEQLEAARGKPEPDVLPTKSRWLVPTVFAVTVAGTIVATVLITKATETKPDPVPPVSGPVVVTVQNMVAIGPEDLQEDTTPSYLSTKPVRLCASPRNNCKIDGTDMGSGTMLVATCVVEGDELVNFNKDSPYPDNPHKARSSRWYRIVMPNKVQGYISAVYLKPEDRNRPLPTCT